MSRLRIRHVTGYSYAGEVTASYNEARMLPAAGEGQLVLASDLRITPVSGQHDYVDYWGTRVLSFEVLTPHTHLEISATSLIEVRRMPHEVEPVDWNDLAASIERSGELVEQSRQTARTAPPTDVAALAREYAAAATDPCSAAQSIAHAIGEAVEYMPGSTTVHSTASDAWQHRRGVCQDIAHLTLGALRSVGIPARYVSGYLHPRRDPLLGETVTGESHAWVEWWCGGWHGYDPTNLIDIGDRHVSVGHGRDYADVAPLRGVFAGPYASKLFVTVEITRER